LTALSAFPAMMAMTALLSGLLPLFDSSALVNRYPGQV
jgi:hypothetical protein